MQERKPLAVVVASITNQNMALADVAEILGKCGSAGTFAQITAKKPPVQCRWSWTINLPHVDDGDAVVMQMQNVPITGPVESE